MNFLAGNVVARFSSQYVTAIEDFCKLVYKKVFFGKNDEVEFVTVEKLIPGNLYINKWWDNFEWSRDLC